MCNSSFFKQYADAFEDEVAPVARRISSSSSHPDDVEPNANTLDASESIFSFDGEVCEDANYSVEETPVPPTANEARRRMDSECSLPFGSPVNPFTIEDQPVCPGKLSPEEVHDNLELPCEAIPKAKREPPRPKDTYYFYQGLYFCLVLHLSLLLPCFPKKNIFLMQSF